MSEFGKEPFDSQEIINRLLRELSPAIQMTDQAASALARWDSINRIAERALQESTAMERLAGAIPDMWQHMAPMAAGIGSVVDHVQALSRVQLSEDQLGWLRHLETAPLAEALAAVATPEVAEAARNEVERHEARVAGQDPDDVAPEPDASLTIGLGVVLARVLPALIVTGIVVGHLPASVAGAAVVMRDLIYEAVLRVVPEVPESIVRMFDWVDVFYLPIRTKEPENG